MNNDMHLYIPCQANWTIWDKISGQGLANNKQ